MTDEEMQRMPWTRDLMTLEEFQLWVASREEAGLKIDIETCELGRWYACDLDPYGIRDALGDLPEELQQIGTNRFVRSPESRGWVDEGDLPPAKGKAMYERIQREADSYENYIKRPKDSSKLWQAKHDLWQVVGNYAQFISWQNGDRTAAVCELEKLGEWLRKWQEQHPDQVDHRKGADHWDHAIASACSLVKIIIDVIAQPREGKTISETERVT